MTGFGPFSVSGEQITALGGANFSQFVNRLLAAEVAANGMVGTTLETTYLDNVGDGGVDAGLRQAVGTTWIPPGDSAWQFKAGDLTPSKCKAEIEGATKAQEILRSGGQYRLVLGKSLNAQLLANRRNALIEKAKDLGITVADGAIEVLGADALARWSERYPALAVSPLLGGIGPGGQTFEQWSSSNRHASNWTPSENRDRHLEDLRNIVTTGDQLDIHLVGVSGLGKTRLVMEALRGQPYEALVVYSPSADAFPVATLSQLQVQERSAVVVIDECDSKSHEVYASVLARETSLRLITIGEPSGASTRSAMIDLSGLEEDSMKALLRDNEPSLWPEAVSVIVEVAAGNIDYALKASQVLLTRKATSAGALVTAADIRSFITEELPDGALFFGCCVLALFSRLGFDGEVGPELSTVATALGFQQRELRSAANALEERGLLTRQGRFRSVSPHPVALYLAARAWSEFGENIVRDLLPNLDPDLTERLFRRATEIGDPETARIAVKYAMGAEGPIGSWDAIQQDGNAQLLVHLAILAPRATTARLEELIASVSDQELLAVRSVRRDLVWALTKLVWHGDTFVDAANILLRLALNENENYTNNATGTWINLFGTMLPGTAAEPNARMAYLTEMARSSEARVRNLAVRAADQALDTHETIAVYGEQQGGTIVQPRGMPKTYGDAWHYRNDAIDLLHELSDDLDAGVAADALKALLKSIHASLEIDANRNRLGEVFATMNSAQLRIVRTQISELAASFDLADVIDDRVPGLEELVAALPPESDLDRLWVLANTHPWDREDGVLFRELTDVSTHIGPNAPSALLELLQQDTLPAAFEVGRTLAVLASHTDAFLSDLARDLDGPRRDAVVGYLWELTHSGITGAFDSFIDGMDASPATKLGLTVRGPMTDQARSRANDLVPQVPVRDGARMLFGWLRHYDQASMAALIDEWRARLESQEDYNAVVDVVALYLHKKDVDDSSLESSLKQLVADRRRYPQLGQQGWDWTQLARRQVASNPSGLATLMVELIEAEALRAYQGSEELQLLEQAVTAAGPEAWAAVMNRIASGGWRLGMVARRGLAGAVDPETARRWVNSDAGRAAVLATTTPFGGAVLSEVARLLLEEFGDNDEVAEALAGQFLSGSRRGPESEWITTQIQQVQDWIQRPGEAAAVVKWGRKLISHLENRRRGAQQQEAEEPW